MSKQLLIQSTYGGLPGVAGTSYIAALYGEVPASGAAAIYYSSTTPTAGTLSRFRITAISAPGAGCSWAFTLRKNAEDTTISCTISDLETSAHDSEHSVSVSAGDYLDIKIVTTGDTPNTKTARWTFEFEPTVSGEYIYGGISGGTAVSADRYLASGCALNATEAYAQCIVPCAGTIKKLYLNAQNAPGASHVYLTSRISGVNGTLTVDLTGAGKSVSDTVNSDAIAANDLLTFFLDVPGSNRYAWAYVFLPSNADNCWIPAISNGAVSGVTTTYGPVHATTSWSSTEGTYGGIGKTGYSVLSIHVTVLTAPTGVKTRTLTLRQAGADEDLHVTITGDDISGNDTGEIALTDDALLEIKSTQTGTPAASYVRTSLIVSAATASPPYDDGTPDGGIVFGGTVVEVGTTVLSDGTSSGGIVMGGPSSAATEPHEVHQIDGLSSGGIVFGGESAERWSAEPNNWVAVRGGTYRINGVIYTLAVTMSYEGLGDIAALVDCDASPAVASTYRYDLLSVDDTGAITVTAGAEAATPVMPTTPAGEVKLDHVLRYYGQTSIVQTDIGKLYLAPMLTTLTTTITDDELSWAEASTAIAVVCRDQYGQLYTGGKVVNASFLSGNGTIAPLSVSGNASSLSFTYTRDIAVTNVSPVIQFASPTGPTAIAQITLLDAGGDPMY